MTRHISNRDLAALIAGTAGDRSRSRVSKHLEECVQCRARHDRILAAIAPRYRDLRASDAAWIRVIRSWEKLAREGSSPAPSRLRSFLAFHPRSVIAASLALAASVAVISVLLIRTPTEPPRPYLSAVQLDRGVTIDGKSPGELPRVYGGSAVSLPDKTMARLVHGRNFSITLIGPGAFSIRRFASGTSSNRMDIECALDQGMLISSSTGGISYSYTTPGARVEPVGTEFLLQSAGGKTLVVMKSGSVRVKPVQSAETVTVTAGNKCMVAEKAEIRKAEIEDLKIFGNIDQLRAGAFKQRLLNSKPIDREVKFHGGPAADSGKSRSDNNQGTLTAPDGENKNQRNMIRRDSIDNPAKPGLKEQGRINKQKKVIRETRKAIRQQRRALR
ncbi:MAG: hypothetical protein KA369_22290 [Spirochaetes bacterium]|nr:hypothetical protein [Spirochaetota bacterium]